MKIFLVTLVGLTLAFGSSYGSIKKLQSNEMEEPKYFLGLESEPSLNQQHGQFYSKSPSTSHEQNHQYESGHSTNESEYESEDNQSQHTTLLSSVPEKRAYILRKVADIYKAVSGERRVNVSIEEKLPTFQDPIYLGELRKQYKLADMNFSNVEISGLNNFTYSQMTFDSDNHMVEVDLRAQDLLITGTYALSNIVKHASGPFTVKLQGGVYYKEKDYFARTHNQIDITDSQATIKYDYMKTSYKDIGLFTQLFEGVFTKKLLEDVLISVNKEIGHKIRHAVLREIRKKMLGEDRNMDMLEESVKSAVTEGRAYVRKLGYASYDIEDIEDVVYEIPDLASKLCVTKVHLDGLDTFHEKYVTSHADNDQIELGFSAQTNPITGYCQIQLKESDKPLVDKYKFKFSLNMISAKAGLKKSRHSNEDDIFKFSYFFLEIPQLMVQYEEQYHSDLVTDFKEKLPEYLKNLIVRHLTMPVKDTVESFLSEAKLRDTEKYPFYSEGGAIILEGGVKDAEGGVHSVFGGNYKQLRERTRQNREAYVAEYVTKNKPPTAGYVGNVAKNKPNENTRQKRQLAEEMTVPPKYVELDTHKPIPYFDKTKLPYQIKT